MLKQNAGAEKPAEEPEEESFPKHVGGPWYDCSDGERIKGKKDAEEYEASLHD